MKKIAIIGLMLLLSACVNLRYDGYEYSNYISLYEQAVKGKEYQCDRSREDVAFYIADMKSFMDHMYLYSSNRVWRSDIAASSKQIKTMIDELDNKQGDFSKTYCKTKFDLISVASMKIVKVLGELQ